MGISSIKLTKEDISSTKTYANLSKMMKSIVVKRKNMLLVENGVNVSVNIGFERWKKQANSSWVNENIVKEIVDCL